MTTRTLDSDRHWRAAVAKITLMNEICCVLRRLSTPRSHIVLHVSVALSRVCMHMLLAADVRVWWVAEYTQGSAVSVLM